MPQRNLDFAKQEILRLHADLTTVEKRLDAVHKSVQTITSDLLGTQQNVLSSLRDEEVVAKAVQLVLSRLPRERQHEPAPTMRYMRDTAVSELMGVSVGALRKWRSERSPKSPPYVRIGRMVLYPMTGLQEYMSAGTIPPRT